MAESRCAGPVASSKTTSSCSRYSSRREVPTKPGQSARLRRLLQLPAAVELGASRSVGTAFLGVRAHRVISPRLISQADISWRCRSWRRQSRIRSTALPSPGWSSSTSSIPRRQRYSPWRRTPSRAQLDLAVKAARLAFERWRSSSCRGRREVLSSFVAAIRSETQSLARLLTREQGKPLAAATRDRGDCVRIEGLLAFELPRNTAQRCAGTCRTRLPAIGRRGRGCSVEFARVAGRPDRCAGAGDREQRDPEAIAVYAARHARDWERLRRGPYREGSSTRSRAATSWAAG